MSRITLCSAILSFTVLLACNKSEQADAKAPAKSDDASKSVANSDDDDGKQAPEAEQPEAVAMPEGYQPHVQNALAQLASGAAITTASAPAYGCSVKYADEGQPATAKVGEPAPTFSLPDLDGNTISLADFAGKTVVLEWFNPDCPFVEYAHQGEGPLTRMPGRHMEKGVVWLAINSGAPGQQGSGIERNQRARKDFGMEYRILVDEDGKVGRLYGAKTTPHMYVVDAAGTLVYRGALDNAPMGRVRGDSLQAYTEDGLTAVSAGTPVAIPETTPYGCSVKYVN